MEVEENMNNKPVESGDEPEAMEMNKTLDITDPTMIRPSNTVEMDIETDLLDNNNNSSNKMEEDEVRSEATFRYTVENLSKLKDQVLSEPCYVRNLPWKIMVMPRPPSPPSHDKYLGFYLQCNGESDSTSWSCRAAATLRLLNHKPGGEPFQRNINHVFFSKENDWGFSHFMLWVDVLDPEKGYIKDDKITLEVHVTAEPPHGVFWDSKKHTGYVGLKNQGATCYMNSLLQTLYFTNALRKAVYKMPTEADDSSKSVALALQRVFHDLQFSDKPVGTKKLTKSFGWETLDSFMQHDVQEFLRVLLDKLESKMKGTSIEGTIPKLFEGKMSSYIKCKNVDYTSTRTETFYDIQLNIKGKKDIIESFEDYVAPENLDGDNKYDAGVHGLQDAEKGVIFVQFPPVLHLHLMRFQYDPITDNSVKFNDRFEFYEHINLDDFLQRPTAASATHEGSSAEGSGGGAAAAAPSDQDNAYYTLHAVLVHSGDNHGGHYVVYINPLGDGKWCKFDDDVVCRCDKKEAIDQNYGGGGGGIMSGLTVNKHCSNAYMLVYIRDSCLHEMLQKISEVDIPTELIDRLTEEKHMEQIRRRERTESNTYMTVNVVLEEYFEFHQTVDLFDPDKVQYRVFKLKRTLTMFEFVHIIKQTFNFKFIDSFRIWKLLYRNMPSPFPMGGGGAVGAGNFHSGMGGGNALGGGGGGNNNFASDTVSNNITRPVYVDAEEVITKQLFKVSDSQNPWYIFLETVDPNSPEQTLEPYDKVTDIMMFFKWYDPKQKRLNYIGLDYFKLNMTVLDVMEQLNKRMGWPRATELVLYQEQGMKVLNPNETIDLAIQPELIDGEILIFERKEDEAVMSEYELPTVQDYFRDLMYRVEVTFVDKTIPNDAGFTLELSQRMNYEQWASAVGQRMNVDPYEIQFFKCQNYKDVPGPPLSSSCDGTLKDVLVYCKPKQQKKIFYQILTMKINELESKKQFKCCWVPINLKEEKEIVLYPSKNGTVGTLLEEARKQVELCPELGSGVLRIAEVIGSKNLIMGPSEDTSLQSLQVSNEGSISNTKMYRIEEVPKDELHLGAEEMLVPVTHFYKEMHNAFGIPFFLKIAHKEPYASIRQRIKSRLNVPDKEWEKYKLVIITGNRVEAVSDNDEVDDDKCLDLQRFKNAPSGFGLEHVNKSQKRSRFNYMEKAIKIYN